MKITVRFLPKGNEEVVDVDDKALGSDLLGKLNLAPDAHIITRNSSPVPIDDEMSNGDVIEIIQVVSGG
jgi:sulfur carrier protein ThiS